MKGSKTEPDEITSFYSVCKSDLHYIPERGKLISKKCLFRKVCIQHHFAHRRVLLQLRKEVRYRCCYSAYDMTDSECVSPSEKFTDPG